MYKIFFPFSFSFSIENGKNEPLPLCPAFCPPFWGGSSAASPLKIWDAMLPYLKRLFEQKNRNLINLTIFAEMTPLMKISHFAVETNCLKFIWWLSEFCLYFVFYFQLLIKILLWYGFCTNIFCWSGAFFLLFFM